MQDNGLLYALTFAGLYLELAGAFLLSAEAIGQEHLLRVAEAIRRHRVATFIVYLVLVALLLVLVKLDVAFHFPEALILILSLGLINDFGPRIIKSIVMRLEKGTAGMIGFLLFAMGFILQAYVSLSALY